MNDTVEEFTDEMLVTLSRMTDTQIWCAAVIAVGASATRAEKLGRTDVVAICDAFLCVMHHLVGTPTGLEDEEEQ